MSYYTGQYRFYAGVDLHARTMYTHVLDACRDGRLCPPIRTCSSLPWSRSARTWRTTWPSLRGGSAMLPPRRQHSVGCTPTLAVMATGSKSPPGAK